MSQLRPAARTTLAACAVVPLALAGLSACGDSESEAGPTTTSTVIVDPSTPNSGSSTPGATPATTRDAGLRAVDPSTFAQAGTHLFRYEPSPGVVRGCILDADKATCPGTPDASAPDIEIPPFPKGRPGAITVTPSTLRYTMIEGVPPAQATLGRGEKVTLGHVTCALPESGTLTCSAADYSFSIDGPSMRIVTKGPVEGAHTTSGATGESAVSGPGTSCGVNTRETAVRIASGSISCSEALRGMDGHGGDGWSCRTTDASHMDGAGRECVRGDVRLTTG